MPKEHNEHNKNLLIVFVKNLVAGKVKSRLALTIGYNNALVIYNDLMCKIHAVTVDLPCDKQVAYSLNIDTEDIWEPRIFDKVQQKGDDIGTRMYNAICNGFKSGYKNVILIGSDIINLKSQFIIDAFNKLEESDLVLGPAKDGGYYLIGMKKPVKTLFEKKEWSTKKVFVQTLKDSINLDLTLGLVPELADLDRIEDFQYLDPKDCKIYMNLIEKDASQVTHPSLFQYIKKGA